MKQVLTGHDIRVLTHELQRLQDSRVNQVYDITSRSICLKLDLNKEKVFLILDSGAKIYTKKEFNSVRSAPTSFCSKLRKHLSNKRVISIHQIRGDRVIDIQFGTGEWEYHVIVELYASGNIILTDREYCILNLLHIFRYDDETVVRVNTIYPIEKATQAIEDTRVAPTEMREWLEKNTPEKKTKLRQILIRSPLAIFGPVIIDHSSALIKLDINQKVDENLSKYISDEQLRDLVSVCEQEANRIDGTKGYIILDGEEYVSVIPYDYEHLKGKPKIEYSSFEEGCDVYFSKHDIILSQEEKSKLKLDLKKEDPKTKVVDNIKEQIVAYNQKKDNAYDTSLIIQSKIESLTQISEFILKSDPLLLQVKISEIDSEIEFIRVDHSKKRLYIKINKIPIDIDYTRSVYKSIGEIYKEGKKFGAKAERAEDVIINVAKSIEKKDRKKDNIQNIIPILGKKKPLWFEQFAWFMSSDNYLVICGKTADDNEMIVKKYLDKTDIYVHSDVSGSGSCVIKNTHNKDMQLSTNIPISTIEQAGQFVICRTSAWKDGSGDKSWWVYPDQVSKTTESGEYVTKGSFIIRGKKNYLSIATLQLGLSIRFKLKDDPILRAEADDRIEYALPMCSPYNATKGDKFRIKITPGKQKIKKVLRDTITRFCAIANIYEKSGIRKIVDDDYHRVLVTGVRFCL